MPSIFHQIKAETTSNIFLFTSRITNQFAIRTIRLDEK